MLRRWVDAYIMLHAVNWHTLWIDNETFAGRHTHCEVGDFISIPVAKASIKGIPFSRKQSSDVLQTPDFELMRTSQNLQSATLCCCLHARSHPTSEHNLIVPHVLQRSHVHCVRSVFMRNHQALLTCAVLCSVQCILGDTTANGSDEHSATI